MSAHPAPGWWIRAAGRAYGPFPSERLPGFVREGRLTPETSVARNEAGPWLPAGRDPSLEELFPTAQGPAVGRPAAAPSPNAAALAPTVRSTLPELPRPAPAGPHAFVVFAELLAGREDAFAHALALAGAPARARPGLWLLRAGGDAAGLRNALSQALGEGESLMVVEAAAADAAWFNLGGEADRALRGLWTAGAAQPAGRSSRA